MANEILVDFVPGLNLYACIWNLSMQVWQVAGQIFEAWGAGSRTAADYDIALTDNSGGHYSGNFDTNISAGDYDISIYQRIGASPADTDPPILSYRRKWGGSRLWSDLNIKLETTISAIQTADTVFDLTDGSATDDIYNNHAISIEDASGNILEDFSIRCSDYGGTNKRMTIPSNCAFALAIGDIVRVYRGTSVPTVAAGGGATVAEILAAVATSYNTPGTVGYEIRQGGGHLSS